MATTTRRQPLATPAEAAAYLARSPKTLRNWRSNGEGPRYVGRGHGVRYRWRDLDAWMDANTH
jgi:helix-turn-helix protein